MHKNVDQVRDQTEERGKMHRNVDKVRDQTEEIIEMHKDIDKDRNKTEKRKIQDQVRDKTKKRKDMHKKIYKRINKDPKRKSQLSDYEQTETRRRYVNIRNRSRYQRKLLETIATDTGFDIICSSCLQYKSFQYCKPVSNLSKENIKKFIVKKCTILKNRSTGQHVCNLCLDDIK